MKTIKIIPIIAALAIAGCASTKSFNSTTSQNYRLKDDANPVSITGKIDRSSNGLVATGANLHVFFNGEPALSGPLQPGYSGDVNGGTWKGKNVSSSCSSKPLTQTSVSVNCIVFIDNERTVTLTF